MPCSDSAIAHRTLPLTYARVAETKNTLSRWLASAAASAISAPPRTTLSAAIHPTRSPSCVHSPSSTAIHLPVPIASFSSVANISTHPCYSLTICWLCARRSDSQHSQPQPPSSSRALHINRRIPNATLQYRNVLQIQRLEERSTSTSRPARAQNSLPRVTWSSTRTAPTLRSQHLAMHPSSTQTGTSCSDTWRWW